MTIHVQCESCNAAFTVPDESAGQRGRCPKCHAVINVPAAEVQAPTPAPVRKRPGRDDSIRDVHRRSRRAPTPSLVGPVVAACAAAAAGALVWGLIARFTGYEVGYVAWGIGGVVGFAAVAVGGRGTGLAVACAVLSLAAILGGKALAVSWGIDSGVDEIMELVTRGDYEENLVDAREFAELPADADEAAIRRFMVDHRYTEAGSPERIAAWEVADFETHTVPNLRRFRHDPPSYATWQQEVRAEVQAAYDAEVSIADGVTESLGPIDLIFALLGVATAFGIVNKA